MKIKVEKVMTPGELLWDLLRSNKLYVTRTSDGSTATQDDLEASAQMLIMAYITHVAKSQQIK